MPVEGFRDHVATDASLLGGFRQMGSMWLISDRGEEMEPVRGMYGTLDAEFEVQRTIKRAELTAFLYLLRRIVGPTTAHAENKGITDGHWRQEVKAQ